MHGAGINLRYIGDVIDSFRFFPNYSGLYAKLYFAVLLTYLCDIDEIVRSCCQILLLEATARIIKNEINKQLREKMHELKLNLEVCIFFQILDKDGFIKKKKKKKQVPYRRVVIHFLNLVFGDSQGSISLWGFFGGE